MQYSIIEWIDIASMAEAGFENTFQFVFRGTAEAISIRRCLCVFGEGCDMSSGAERLRQFFAKNSRVALAFSGGVDSAYLLYAAVHSGAQVRAYYVKSAFQPQFELDDARRLATELGADMRVLAVDVLANPTVAANPADRCYHCKSVIFSTILRAATEDDFPLLMDGTNASDDAGDRPGMRALRELAVRSPLRECGLTKAEVRCLSKEAGLFTWNKPAYACLATRIPTSEAITPEALQKTEISENYLHALGFSGFRVRLYHDGARLQLPETQLPLLMEKRRQVLDELKKHYGSVLLDLEERNGQ